MATTFKNLGQNDVISTKTLLHENIPLTGTIVSGTYDAENIKSYSHGIFQSVFDYPYLSSSANHIFDVSAGYSTSSPLYTATTLTANQKTKKNNLYNQLAQLCVGYDTTGSIQQFDADGDILSGGAKINTCVFLTFSRLVVKDEIKKGSVSLKLGTGPKFLNPFAAGNPSTTSRLTTVTDVEGSDTYYVNSPAGEYGILWAEKTTANNISSAVTDVKNINGVNYVRAGLVFYQAGVMVLTSSVFMNKSDTKSPGYLNNAAGQFPEWHLVDQCLTASISGSTNDSIGYGLRRRINEITFNNTTELNSTIYFCRANHDEFNYSPNPTYLAGSKIIVRDDEPLNLVHCLSPAELNLSINRSILTTFCIPLRLILQCQKFVY